MDEDTKKAIRALYDAFEDLRAYIAIKCPPQPEGILLRSAKQYADDAYDLTNRREELGYVPKDDPRLNTIIGPPRSPEKQREE